MEKLFLRLNGVEITWRGVTERKDRKTGDIIKRDEAQGKTVQGMGAKPFNYDFGGVPDVLKGLVVGEKVDLDVAIKPYNDAIYVDILRVSRGGGDVPGHVGAGKGKVV